MDPFLNAFKEVSSTVGEWIGDAEKFLDSDTAKDIGEGMQVMVKDQQRRREEQRSRLNVGRTPKNTASQSQASQGRGMQSASAEELENRWKAKIAAYVSAAQGTEVRSATPSNRQIEKIINA